MKKIKLEILGLSASHSPSGSFAMVLGEETGNRRLPIIIGMFEAQAIAVELEKITSNRPMTHDLFKHFATQFDIVVKEIFISDLREGVFYAKMLCALRDGTQYAEVDARPSDAVAIGLRFNAPIYASESVMREAGIVLSEMDAEEFSTMEQEEASEAEAPQALKDMPTEKLQQMMQEAIENEDYERAASIRDELGKRDVA